jgi:hypothetical protein
MGLMLEACFTIIAHDNQVFSLFPPIALFAIKKNP